VRSHFVYKFSSILVAVPEETKHKKVLLKQTYYNSKLPLARWPSSAHQIKKIMNQNYQPCWAHMNITLSLPHSHTYFCLARFIVNITHHQHDNDKTLQGITCYACSLVGILVYNFKSHMKLGKEDPHMACKLRVGQASAIVFSVRVKLTPWHLGGFGYLRIKNSSFQLPYQRPSSSADCARELFNGSSRSASLVDCTRKKFLPGGCGLFVTDVISEVVLGSFWLMLPGLGPNH